MIAELVDTRCSSMNTGHTSYRRGKRCLMPATYDDGKCGKHTSLPTFRAVSNCEFPWPVECREAWPVSRFAWCHACRRSYPAVERTAHGPQEARA